MKPVVIPIKAKDNTKQAFSSLKKSIVGVGKASIALNQGLELSKKALNALSAPFKSVLTAGLAFEKQMSAVKAISATTAKEFQSLSNEAKRIGETTAFSASEAGEAMEELRRAGQSVTEILDTTASTMALAQATSTDLGTAAGFTATQLNIFKDQGLEAANAVDLMVKTVGASPQNFADFQEAMEASSGTASSVGIKYSELTQIVGALAENGVRGAKAGTALNGVIGRLLNPAKAAKDILEKYDISMQSIDPTANKFADILDVLNKAGMTQGEVLKLLGQEAGPKFLKMIDQGGDSLRNMAEKQLEANDATTAARIMTDNLSGDMKIFGSTMDGLKIGIFERLKPVLRTVVKHGTALVSKFKELLENDEGVNTFFESIKETINNIKMEDIIDGFKNTIKWIQEAIEASSPFVDAFVLVTKAIGGVILGLAGFIKEQPKVTKAILLISGGLLALSIAGGPISLIITAIAGVVWAFNNWSTVTSSVVKSIKSAFDWLSSVVMAPINAILNVLNSVISAYRLIASLAGSTSTTEPTTTTTTSTKPTTGGATYPDGTQKKFANGGPVFGPSHLQGGVMAELEGGEYILSKRQVQNMGSKSGQTVVNIYDGTGQKIQKYDSAIRVEIKERANRFGEFAAI